MAERKEEKDRKVPFFASLQTKYALSYLSIFIVVLVLMNTYPVLASQDLVFTSKRDSLKNQAAVMASALMELESLSADQVVRVMNMLDNMGLTRILVTDPAGLILYDSTRDDWGGAGPPETAEEEPTEYRYALYREITAALRGKDVFYSRYTDQVFTSTAACPIVYRGMVIGAIYVLEVDEAQGALLQDLQENLRNISVVVAIVTLILSALFSQVLAARVGALLGAIRIVGQGEYGHRLQPEGKDELAALAEEFNQLTDRLQTTEEVRRRFVADASHELKTPLASIRLLADSILQTDRMEEEMVREFVTDIGSEADRLTRITEHLLTLTRLDSIPEPGREPVEMGRVVERVAHMLRPLAAAVNVELRCDLEPACTLLCTEDDLYQIIFNLVENAIKYNLPGGKVEVSVFRQEGRIILEVADTGVGIPEEDMPRIFERFYRVDKARSRAAGGTGLGLSIVSDTAKAHKGTISVQKREDGPGTRFTATFPAYAEGGVEE